MSTTLYADEVRATIPASGSLRQMVRDGIATSASPDAAGVSRLILVTLPDDMVQEVLLAGVVAIVKAEQRKMRAEAMAAARNHAQDQTPPETSQRRRERQKDEARDEVENAKRRHREAQESKFFNSWVTTPTGAKFLGDCTASDLRFSGSQKREQADAVIVSAERDERLADHIDASRFRTLRTMGYENAIKGLA